MPPQPLRHIVVGALLGDQESIPSINLPSVYSSGGSKNIWIDQYGVGSGILGYTKQNAAALVSHTGGAAMRVRALYHYIKQSAGVITRQEIGILDDAAAHYEFRYSTDIGVTWTFVSDLGAASVATIPDFAQAGNTLVMTNGVLAPQTWDGAALTTISSTQLAAPTITNGGTGNLTGNYQWRVVPIKSDGTRKVSSVTSAITPLNASKGSVAWVADTDVTVASYEVYRTTGTGLVFYFEGAVVGRLTVAFTSNTLDAEIIGNRALQEYGDAPAVGVYFCEMHKERMWYGRTDAKPRTWYYSDPGLPFSVYTAFNFFDMTDAESISDVSTGGTGNYKGMFVAWHERSIWTISGTGTVFGAITDFTRRRTSARAGTVSHRTVTLVPAGAKYVNAEGNVITTSDNLLAYLTPFGDVRLFDGDNDAIISFAKATTLKTLNYIERRKSFCITDAVRGEITWVFPMGTSAEPNYAVTWNYRFGVWYDRTWSFGHGLEIESASASSVLIAGQQDLTIGAYVYLLWSGTTFDGTAIAWALMTKTFYGTGDAYRDDTIGTGGAQLLSYQKRWRWVDVLMKVTGQMNVTVEWLRGEASDLSSGQSTVASVGSAIETIDNQAIQSADLSALFAVLTPSILRAKFVNTGIAFQTGGMTDARYFYARGMRLRFSSPSTTQAFSIYGFDIAYQLLPGLRRTFTQ